MAKKKDKDKNLSSKEITKILNTGFGVLNPVYDTLTSKNFDSSDTSFFDLARESVIRTFQPNTLAGTGPYIGIVLRDEGQTNLKIEDKKSWAAAAYSHRIKDQQTGAIRPELVNEMPKLRQLRVRIPELHASLPIPERLPLRSQNTDEADKKAHRVINMYPVFVAQNSAISGAPINPATFVWVDFQNRNTMQGGIFLSVIESRQSFEDYRTGEKDVVAKDPYQACLDGGGSPETCASYNDGNVIYQSGGAVSNLQIRRAEPVIKQGSGFPYNFVKVLGRGTPEESQKQLNDLRNNPGYSSYHKAVYNSGATKLTQYRAKLWAYGAALPNQVERYNGAKIHKLIVPRLNDLQAMWQLYLSRVIGVAIGNFSGASLNPAQITALKESFPLPAAALFDTLIGTNSGLEISTRKTSAGKESTAPEQAYSGVIDLKSGFRSGASYSFNARHIKKFLGSAKIDYNLDTKVNAYPSLSAHSIGLAVDFGNNGLNPTNASNSFFKAAKIGGTKIDGVSYPKKDEHWAAQYDSQLYIFLLKYGWLFGLYNYVGEPWQWELQPPRQAWKHIEEYAINAEDYRGDIYNGFYLGGYKSITANDLAGGDKSLISDAELQNIYKQELTLMGYLSDDLSINADFVYAVNCVEESKQTGATLNTDASGALTTRTLIEAFLKANDGTKSIKFVGSKLKLNSSEIEKVQNADNDPKIEGKIKWFATSD